MTANVILEYTLDYAISDGILSDAVSITRPEHPRFPLGRLIITTNAAEQLPLTEVNAALARHASGDWGELSASDAKQNAYALKHGSRLFSVYASSAGMFWIITEADRSATTILMPEDY
ncbi:hypothetical protein AB1L88_25905 [Tautonia sp. JC769]|uniref:hypothetical protein n=1 Tax=Tautonia sp. JC769 TaxID=3232135 RepID=UPI0034584C1A